MTRPASFQGRRRPAPTQGQQECGGRREQAKRPRIAIVFQFESELAGHGRPGPDRLGVALGLQAGDVGVGGDELLPSSSVGCRPANTVQLVEVGLGDLLRLVGVDLLDARLDRLVDQDDAAEDVADVAQARGGDEARLSALPPTMKREFFHASKYSDIVGDHHDHRDVRVLERRLPLLGLGVELLLVLDEVGRRGQEEVGVRQGLRELDLAVAVEVGLDALGLELRLGAEDRRLDQREEVARLLELARPSW